MIDFNDIRDDQIRILGDNESKKNPGNKRRVTIALIMAIGIIIAGIALFTDTDEMQSEPKEPEKFLCIEEECTDSAPGFIEIQDTVINDIPIRLFIPHNAEMSLHIGLVDKTDTTIIYAAQAADIRADNGGIVGAFVLKGEPRAWGLSKKGFCASISGKVTIGVADNSPLFEEATEKGGYFFRQYPLVSNGKVVDNEVKGKSIRRGICDCQGRIFMVETLDNESFHDFSQALTDLGVEQAIYLVGASAHSWAVDKDGTTHYSGNDGYYTGQYKLPENISYIVWKKK